MRLKLVLKGPERLMGAQVEKTLEHGSLVIGRSPAAGWVLPDPERLVSKAHCRIDRDFSGFVLTDTSTNGVRVNDESVGFGMPRLLADGDVLKLGDAVVLVHVESAAVPATDAPRPRPVPAAVPVGLDGPFGLAESGPPDATVADSPPTAAPARPQAPSEKILDDWWKSDTSPGGLPEAKPVDIFPQEAGDAILRTITPKDSLPLNGGDVAFFVESLADVDLMALARAVDEAALLLPEDERRRFRERLRDLLAGNGSLRA